MLSTRIGTQAFSKAPQTHDFHEEKINYTPATQASVAAAPGEQKNVGEILNEIANPGGDHRVGQHIRKAHNTLDKDDFLKLMLTQMKNQDPMNPMKSHEMAAQLAQFTSLEQLFNVNKNLENLSKAQGPLQKFQALNLLGRSIKADSRDIFRAAGDKASDLRFSLLGDAAAVKVKILDDNGKAVKTIEVSQLKKGANKVSWAGLDEHDQEVRPGHYTFEVEATNGAGHKVGVQTSTDGMITGVNYTREGTLLLVGNQKIKLEDVQQIEDEHLQGLTKAANVPAPALAPASAPTTAAASSAKKAKPEAGLPLSASSESAESAPIRNIPGASQALGLSVANAKRSHDESR